MQSQTPPPTPVAPGTPQPVVAVEVPAAQGPTRPINEAEISVIRRQRSEMSEQLGSSRGRREDLLDEIRSAPPGTEQGLLEHLKVVNERIVNIESDLERSGQTLRSGQVPVGLVIVPPRFQSSSDAAERGAAISAMVLIPIMFVFWASRWRRGKRREEHRSPEQDARFDRLEQAVDAIALEIERVGESQRYQQKVLAEANLMPAINAGQRVPVEERFRG